MSLLTPDELKELRRLQIRAGRRVDAVLAGEYRSAVRGQGMEFEEVRAYVPGDDVRHIDWNVTARTGEPFIKVFREERQLTVLLAVDISGSVQVGTGGRDGRTDRRLQVARLAAGIAWAGQRNRDRVGLLTFTDTVETYLPARSGRAHNWAVIRAAYEASAVRRTTDLDTVFRRLTGMQRRRATLVIISDFLDDGDWERSLAALCQRHTVFAFCLHDELDTGLPGLGLVEVEDAETGRRQLVDASALRGTLSVDARMSKLRRAGARAHALTCEDDAFRLLRKAFSAPKGGRR